MSAIPVVFLLCAGVIAQQPRGSFNPLRGLLITGQRARNCLRVEGRAGRQIA